jgi:hypothetical protein
MDEQTPATPAPAVLPANQVPELPVAEQKEYAIKVVAKQCGLSILEASASVASWTEEKLLALATAGRAGIVAEYEKIVAELKPAPAVEMPAAVSSSPPVESPAAPPAAPAPEAPAVPASEAPPAG